MKYISLFAGIGGFDLALNRLGHECVYVNEWDKFAAQTYEKNFKHKLDTRSITTVSAEEIPYANLLVGGFPCQSFSIAGKRKGFTETRGTLFFEICRIARAKRIPYLLLENVKGLLSHDNGKTFSTIIRSLDGMGYDCQWQVLNSKNFGVPQNRERVFIIGHLRGQRRPKVFPITQNGEVFNKSKRQISPTITARYYKQGQSDPYISRFPLKFLQRNQKNIDGDYAFTVDTANTGGVRIDRMIRKFTPIECERLQGFPDNWTEGVSDSQRYKQCGNAVTVNVVEEIMKRF